MLEALQFEFMRNALIAGFLTAVACGVIGSLIVVNRIVFISGGVAHAAYGGIGLAFFLGFSPLIGASLFGVASALVIAAITYNKQQNTDTVIGVIWAVGMATGIILVDMTPGYNVDLMSYLFGSILAVPRSDLLIMASLDVFILITVGYFYFDFLAMSYDQEFAYLRGVPVRPLYYLMLALVALTVVMTIRVVGLILVIALLTIPTYIAQRLTGSLRKMMFVAFLLSVVFTFCGLWLSYSLNITSGAAIILVAAVGFALFHLVSLFKGIAN